MIKKGSAGIFCGAFFVVEGISCTDRVKQSESISVGVFHKSCRWVRQFPDGIAACGLWWFTLARNDPGVPVCIPSLLPLQSPGKLL